MKNFLNMLDYIVIVDIGFVLVFAVKLTFTDWQFWTLYVLIFITRQLRYFTAEQ